MHGTVECLQLDFLELRRAECEACNACRLREVAGMTVSVKG